MARDGWLRDVSTEFATEAFCGTNRSPFNCSTYFASQRYRMLEWEYSVLGWMDAMTISEPEAPRRLLVPKPPLGNRASRLASVPLKLNVSATDTDW